MMVEWVDKRIMYRHLWRGRERLAMRATHTMVFSPPKFLAFLPALSAFSKALPTKKRGGYLLLLASCLTSANLREPRLAGRQAQITK